jgi:hypothetical protein
MAEKYPLANGNWSNAANWNGGTKPTASDDVHANNFTVTIDENVTVNRLLGIAGAVAVANGVFATSGNVTVNVADIVLGGNATSGTVRINSGAILNANVGRSTFSARASVQVNAGGVINGDAVDGDAINVAGGKMNGNATAARVHNAIAIIVSLGGEMIGDGHGDTFANPKVRATTGGVVRGNSVGGTAANAGAGVQAALGGFHIGNSQGGTGAFGLGGTDLREGGVQIGNATGSATAANPGTRVISGSLFFGNATGGGVANAHGLSIDTGFAQVGTATGTTSGAFGVSGSGSATVLIGSESGSFAKSLDATVLTTNERYPFEGEGTGTAGFTGIEGISRSLGT